MKISKKQLRQIINEELEAIKDNIKPDVARTQKQMDSRGITKMISSKINTWQELEGFLSGIVQSVPVKDNQKLLVLRKLVQQLSSGDTNSAEPAPDAPPAPGPALGVAE